ncbi:FAD-dependent oxidoreductase [Streptomyces sp. M19]
MDRAAARAARPRRRRTPAAGTDRAPGAAGAGHLALAGGAAHDSGHYLLAFDDSRVVVGATRETGSGFDHRVTAGGLRAVLDAALSVAPGLADATHLETRIGFRPQGPTGAPVGRPAGVEGLVVLTGLGPTGLTVGPWAGGWPRCWRPAGTRDRPVPVRPAPPGGPGRARPV